MGKQLKIVDANFLALNIMRPPDPISISVQANGTQYVSSTPKLAVTITWDNSDGGGTSVFTSGYTCSPSTWSATPGSQTITVTYSSGSAGGPVSTTFTTTVVAAPNI